MAALRDRYQSDVEVGDLRITLFPAVHASGENLLLRQPGRRDLPPLVAVRRFTLDARFVSFFRNPKRIRSVRLEGLRIIVQPRSGRSPNHFDPAKLPFVLDEVVADGATLESLPKDPDKDPLVFDIRRLTLHTVGIGLPMTFHAELTNPKPPGLIRSDGSFGPWSAADPAGTPVSGNYTFRDADLGVFPGIRGTLASDGRYTGQLNRIEVQGTTDTPDFALSTGGHPMALHTDFQATVDGANGDTVLHPVRARLGASDFEIAGAIDRVRSGQGKTILLNAKAGRARLEDFLALAVNAPKPPLKGGISFQTRVEIPPGKAAVVERLRLDGVFSLARARFTSDDVQRKIAGLSHHAQGDPNNQDPNIDAAFQGHFRLRNGLLALPDLQFEIPGAKVDLKGKYALRTGDLDFTGTAKLDAPVSRMTTGVKSLLLN